MALIIYEMSSRSTSSSSKCDKMCIADPSLRCLAFNFILRSMTNSSSVVDDDLPK